VRYLSSPPLSIGLVETVAGRVEQLCQNRRANQCVRSRDGLYNVRDVNKGCALSLPTTLLRVIKNQPATLSAVDPRVLHGLQVARRRVVKRATLKLPNGASFSPAAQCTCLDSAGCRSRSECTWRARERQCVPARATQGFEGVLPFAGQTAEPGRALRADYGAVVNQQRWRRAAQLPMLTAAQQMLAWQVPPLSSSSAIGAPARPARLRHDEGSLLLARKKLGANDLNAFTARERLVREHLRVSNEKKSPEQLLAGLPLAPRESVKEIAKRRAGALARPLWKRGIPTVVRSELKAAVARHVAMASGGADLLRLLTEDPRVGPRARDDTGALTQQARNYALAIAAEPRGARGTTG
jgi:hypothetical protein